ncbi:MAG: ABC transporter substrate-binding protein [Tissierellia bacterium]|nr:ABC transporter substrate-binding protein [Tissierellia bacterium]
MNKYFDIKDTVYDVTEKYPETLDVFIGNGFEQLANDKMRKLMGRTISVAMACKTKKVNVELFEEKLVEAIELARNSVDDALAAQKNKDENSDIRIDGVLPCPIRIPLLESFNKWVEDNKDSFGFTIDYELKSANLGVDWIIDRVNTGKPDDLSDLFMSAGFELFFDEKLMGKYKNQGIFEDITGLEKLNKDFDNDYIDLKDPEKQYSIIGVVPAVFMVNVDQLNGREMPKSWEDILKPEFESSVSIPMRDLDLFNAIMLHLQQKYGDEAVTKLGRSLMRSMHPAEMVKSPTRNTSGGIPTVTIMPYFFTKMALGNTPLTAVWPEDGAIISPIFLLAKKSSKDKTKRFVDFFFSKEVGQVLALNGHMPSTNPEVDNGLVEGQKFMWLGWDYINRNDIGSKIKECEKLFHEAI